MLSTGINLWSSTPAGGGAPTAVLAPIAASAVVSVTNRLAATATIAAVQADGVVELPVGDLIAPQRVGNPVIASDGLSIAITYDETLAGVPAFGDASLSGTSALADSSSGVGTTVWTIGLGSPILASETVTITTTNGPTDAAANEAATMAGQACTNNSTVVLDTVIITRFNNASGNFPATVVGTAIVRCWSGGGGSTTNVSGGGGGSYSCLNAYVYTANEAWTIAIGAGGTAGGGTGGNTTFQSTACVAAGAVGNAGGLAASCTGDVKRSGANGATGVGVNNLGGASPGSSTAAVGNAPGGPEGAPGGVTITAASARVPGGGAYGTVSAQRAGAAGMAQLIYQIVSAATHPDLVGAAVTRSEVDNTAHTIVLPDGSTGDTLVYVAVNDGSATQTLDGATLVSDASGAQVRAAMYSYVVDGSEPTSLGLSASEAAIVIVLRYRNVSALSGTSVYSGADNGNPPSHDMGSSAATTWLAAIGIDSTTTTDGFVTARPTNYDESIYVPCFAQSGGVAACLAWRDATAQTEDPSAWANTGANVTITAGIRR